MCSPHLQSGLNDSKVLSQCEQGKGSGGKSVAVRRPRLAVAIVACVSVSSLPISLSLSLSLSLHPVVGCSRKKESHVTKLLIVEWDGLVYCSSFSHFRGGGTGGGGGLTMGAVHLLQCLHKYLRIIRRFQRGYYAIFLLILLCLLQATEKKRKNE